MVKYGKTRSTVKPEPIVMDEFSVWQCTNITPVSENAGAENEFVGFEFDMIQFDKNEFILQQAEENANLQQQVTDTQLALCEVYEQLPVTGV